MTRLLPVMASVVVAIVALLLFVNLASADLQPGSYSLEVNIAEEVVPIGESFTVQVAVNHNEGPYQAVQWSIDYPESVVEPVPFTSGDEIRGPAAPSECSIANNNGNRLLLGCLAFTGPELTYSGTVWNIDFSCTSEGSAQFAFIDETFVRLNLTDDATVHTHPATVVCGEAVPGGGETVVATGTPSAGRTPAAGTPGATNGTAAASADTVTPPAGELAAPNVGTGSGDDGTPVWIWFVIAAGVLVAVAAFALWQRQQAQR